MPNPCYFQDCDRSMSQLSLVPRDAPRGTEKRVETRKHTCPVPTSPARKESMKFESVWERTPAPAPSSQRSPPWSLSPAWTATGAGLSARAPGTRWSRMGADRRALASRCQRTGTRAMATRFSRAWGRGLERWRPLVEAKRGGVGLTPFQRILTAFVTRRCIPSTRQMIPSGMNRCLTPKSGGWSRSWKWRPRGCQWTNSRSPLESS